MLRESHVTFVVLGPHSRPQTKPQQATRKDESAIAMNELTERQKKRRARTDIPKKLVDAAEKLIKDEGYGVATARRIASEVGLKHQAVFYYFGSQDELLLAVYRRFAERKRKIIEAAFESDQPLSTLWGAISDTEITRFSAEFIALANHNSLVRDEMAKDMEEVRRFETQAIASYLASQGVEPQIPPLVVTILIHSMALFLRQEKDLGVSLGHELTEAMSNASFARFEKLGLTTTDVEPIIDGLNAGMQS